MLMQLLLTVVLVSFAGSLHCVGMCGPLVAFAVGDPRNDTRARRLWLHIAYHGGRLASYLFVGAACGLLGAAVDRGGARFGLHRTAATMAGGLMIAVGLAAALRAVGARLPQLPLPRAIQRGVLAGQRAALAFAPLPRALTIGLLTAFLPCGWLYMFATGAAGAGSMLGGAVFMAAFWLGNVPALLLTGVGVQALTGLIGRRLPLVTALIFVALGVVTLVFGIQAPVRAFQPKQALSDAELAKQVEGFGKTVPPCCQTKAERAAGAEN